MYSAINIRHTTVKELAAIKQAVKIFSNGGKQIEFKKKGWIINKQGGYKKVYIKNGIVVKIGPIKQLVAEEARWLKSKPSKKKYLARVFGRIDNMLIQRRVRVCTKSWNCEIADSVAKRLKLNDWGHNHGHDKDGTTKFFDCTITRGMILWTC